jgi:hypothetical protein
VKSFSTLILTLKRFSVSWNEIQRTQFENEWRWKKNKIYTFHLLNNTCSLRKFLFIFDVLYNINLLRETCFHCIAIVFFFSTFLSFFEHVMQREKSLLRSTHKTYFNWQHFENVLWATWWIEFLLQISHWQLSSFYWHFE